MTDIPFLSAVQLKRKLDNKLIGCLELCDLYIDRITELDDETNAVVVRDFDRARLAAKEADNTAVDQRGPVHGLPLTIKEAFNVAGLPTTWGLPPFKDMLVAEDATVVKKYKEAGAIFLGKTNVPVNLGDFQSYNPIYGTTNNPWDLKRTPGGSSGGAAVAMAAGYSALETGSDIGGSIRNPAHYCGVYGHKPTWGVVPPQGHALPRVLAAPDIAVCGPLARSAEDLKLAMEVISGPEVLNAEGWKLDLPAPRKKSLKEFKVVVWSNDAMSPVDDAIESRVLSLAKLLEQKGAMVSYTARPAIDLGRAHRTYMGLMHSIMGAGADPKTYKASKAYAASLDPKDLSDMAVMTRAMVLSHREWLRINNFREKMRYACNAFFNEWDIILCPQMATTAFEHDHINMSQRMIQVNGEKQPYFQQVYWSGFAIASYLPSTVFPTGPAADGLPIGLQAIAGAYQDYTSIEFARLVAEEIGGYTIPNRYL